MTPAEWVASEQGQAVVEAMARAICAFRNDGMERCVQRERGYCSFCRELARAGLLAALTVPGERPCPECGGSGRIPSPWAPDDTENEVSACSSCRGTGTVPGVPAIIDAVMEQVGWLRAPASMRPMSQATYPGEVPIYRLRRPRERP